MEVFLITNKKAFMTALLSSGTFDSFLLEKASVKMASDWEISGRINKDFYDSDSLPSYELICWSDIHPMIREIIKGKTAPVSFSFALRLKPEFAARVTPGFSDMVSIRMDSRTTGSDIRLVTGVSADTFSLDKSADAVWDQTFRKFLSSKAIDFEIEHT